MGRSKRRLTLELGSAHAGQMKLGSVSAKTQSENKSFIELSNLWYSINDIHTAGLPVLFFKWTLGVFVHLPLYCDTILEFCTFLILYPFVILLLHCKAAKLISACFPPLTVSHSFLFTSLIKICLPFFLGCCFTTFS